MSGSSKDRPLKRTKFQCSYCHEVGMLYEFKRGYYVCANEGCYKVFRQNRDGTSTLLGEQ